MADNVWRMTDTPIPSWSPTCTLRILERHYPSGDARTKLQQLWRSDDGREHWRDVPTHTENVVLDE